MLYGARKANKRKDPQRALNPALQINLFLKLILLIPISLTFYDI
ncbi:hypothetical protein DB41_KR00050 [Neochlamydia sp. TUME1]|nr:hypothetical protein DB41_KR00050 [Neochlamydia sp. TUME1]